MTNTSQVYPQRYCDRIDFDECELANCFYDLLGL